ALHRDGPVRLRQAIDVKEPGDVEGGDDPQIEGPPTLAPRSPPHDPGTPAPHIGLALGDAPPRLHKSASSRALGTRMIIEGAILDADGARSGYVRFREGEVVEVGQIGTDSTRGRVRRRRGIVFPRLVNGHTH